MKPSVEFSLCMTTTKRLKRRLLDTMTTAALQELDTKIEDIPTTIKMKQDLIILDIKEVDMIKEATITLLKRAMSLRESRVLTSLMMI